jgi:hypothetical protein
MARKLIVRNLMLPMKFTMLLVSVIVIFPDGSSPSPSSILHSPSLAPLHCNLHQNHILIGSEALRDKRWLIDYDIQTLYSSHTHRHEARTQR